MDNTHRSTPPPAQSLVILSADLLAVSVKKMLDELAGAANWPTAQRVRNALDTYETVRTGGIIADSDPQCVQLNEPAPITQRSEARRG